MDGQSFVAVFVTYCLVSSRNPILKRNCEDLKANHCDIQKTFFPHF